MKISIVEVIQLMLAPGIMISACGLLLLGMNNKYSLVVNRIRLLNEEKRRLFTRAGERDFNYEENIRLESISVQLKHLSLPCKDSKERRALLLGSSGTVCYHLASYRHRIFCRYRQIQHTSLP